MIAAGCRLRLNAIVISSRKNQETSFGARVLDGRAHQRVDQLLQHDLTRHRFGHLDHGRQIEVLDGCLDRRGRIGDRLLGSDLRIELLELSNLCVRAPAAIAVAGIPQVGRRNLLEAARRVKASGPLVGDRLDCGQSRGCAPNARLSHRGLERRARGLRILAISAPTIAARFSKVTGLCWAHTSSCLW